MCGISGEIGFGVRLTDSMVAMQQHRGPDNSTVKWFNTISAYGVTMGHNRLAIIDLSNNSRQPIWSKDRRYMMVYNGECYNYRDFGNYASDTLMLIDQIGQFGFSETLPKLNGQFSIAVYDTLQHVLHIAIDPTGQKPCYYYHDGSKFTFASEPSALTSLKDKWDLDTEAMEHLWCLGSVGFDRSLFKGIKRVPGSYHLRFECGLDRVSLEKWWQLNPDYDCKNIEELAEDAIDKVKVADVPVNMFLSGGIDSTLVASRFKGAKAIHLDSEEKIHAHHVAIRNNIDLHVLPVEFNKEEVLSDYARKTGDCAMSAIQPYLTSKAAKQLGKVAVIANGADELFYGYPRTHDIFGLRHMMRGGYECIMNDMERLYLDEYEVCSPDQFERLLELRIYIQNDLNKVLDFASMCNSVEVRAPFLDPRLINAAMALSYDKHTSKQYGGKTILKKMLSRLGYSDAFLTRPKEGFSIPKKHQQSNEPAIKWAIQNGFLKERKDWNARDRQYVGATAASFKAWWSVWNHKIN